MRDLRSRLKRLTHAVREYERCKAKYRPHGRNVHEAWVAVLTEIAGAENAIAGEEMADATG